MEVGKIYTKDEANTLYGAVQQSKGISSAELTSLLGSSKNYLMFKIINGQLVILGDKRVVLYPKDYKVDNKEVFAVYSIGKVKELLDTGKAATTSVEQRKDVISINNGGQTMEISQKCPPFCNGS
jgi:hypothetical protein